MGNHVVVLGPSSIAREGLCRIISEQDFVVTAAAPNASDVDWGRCPDGALVLLDYPQRQEQVEAVDSVMRHHRHARCIVLVEEFDLDAMMLCFARKAHGYLVKDIGCSPLIASLRLASLGEKVLPSNLIEVLAQQCSRYFGLPESEPEVGDANLSQREMDVLCCLMAGNSNKVIARQLDLSEATVKVHVKAILRKLKVGNRTQAAIWGTAHQVANGHAHAHAQ